jgi:hypothetical protein
VDWHKEGCPENGRADRKVIVQMAGGRKLRRVHCPVFMDLAERESKVCGSPVILKIKPMLYQD